MKCKLGAGEEESFHTKIFAAESHYEEFQLSRVFPTATIIRKIAKARTSQKILRTKQKLIKRQALLHF